MNIPKTFHHIWIGSPVPETLKSFRQQWMAYYPDWEFKLWTDENIPKLRNQALYDAIYQREQKLDLIRFEVVLNEGGVYLDFDYDCLRNIEHDLERLVGGADEFVLIDRAKSRGVYDPSVMGAVKGSSVFESIVKSFPVQWSNQNEATAFRVEGVMEKGILQHFKNPYEIRHVGIGMFMPYYEYITVPSDLKKNVCAIHYNYGTWQGGRL